MNAKTLFLLALCAPLAACDLVDSEDEMTSADDSGGEEDGGEEAGGEEAGGEESGGEESSGEESSGEESSEGSSSGGTPEDPPDEVPGDLVGSWYTGNGDTHLETLDLFTDGTYQEDKQRQMSIDGCLTAYDHQLSGEYSVVGDVLQLHPTTSHLFVDECGTVGESEELPADGVFEYRLGADVWGYTLLLTPADGSNAILYHRL